MKSRFNCLGLAFLFLASALSAEVTRVCEVDHVTKEVTFATGKELNAKLRARNRKAAYEPASVWVSLRMNTSLMVFRVDDVKFENGEMTAEGWRSFFIGQAQVTASNDDWGRITIVARKGFDWVDPEENARLGRKKQS